jgi:hypothetical protein
MQSANFLLRTINSLSLFCNDGKSKMLIAKKDFLYVHPFPPLSYLIWIEQFTLYFHNLVLGNMLGNILGTTGNLIGSLWEQHGNFLRIWWECVCKTSTLELFSRISWNQPYLKLEIGGSDEGWTHQTQNYESRKFDMVPKLVGFNFFKIFFKPKSKGSSILKFKNSRHKPLRFL